VEELRTIPETVQVPLGGPFCCGIVTNRMATTKMMKTIANEMSPRQCPLVTNKTMTRMLKKIDRIRT
jgi:hypothetical protein